MARQSRTRPAKHLRTPQAAHWLGISPRTMERYRGLGCGPVFYALGGRITYSVQDLREWVENARCNSLRSENYIRMRSAVSRRQRGMK